MTPNDNKSVFFEIPYLLTKDFTLLQYTGSEWLQAMILLKISPRFLYVDNIFFEQDSGYNIRRPVARLNLLDLNFQSNLLLCPTTGQL